ncbi:hypothetical protein CAK95_13295 [Pseudorhodoplanes sinuspersici]|uniref:Uncharacterized protein n=1 Tax=Pseudorhodoplanes sinuspersici TaxID=1235591 RepID=A0A1W6ZS61_9HYPH|nr:hypothetical protein CAK95_13295 [Pseudorhodoplanes sinuspersici]
MPEQGWRQLTVRGAVLRKRIDSFSSRFLSLVPGWRRRLTLSFAVFAVALAASAAIVPQAYAADDDDEEDTIETKFIKGLLGINDKDRIDYRERPPLVVPPNIGTLPPPETTAVTNSPAWPKDPEVVERKKRQQANKNQRRKTFEEEARPLTPAELDAPGRAARGSSRPNPTGPQDSEGPDARALRPDELGVKGSLLGNLFKDNTQPEQATFTQEPARTDLTQPPPGYQTPSPSQVYGIAPRKEQPKPFDWINKHGTSD